VTGDPEADELSYNQKIARLIERMTQPDPMWLPSAYRGQSVPYEWCAEAGTPCMVRSCLRLGACRRKAWTSDKRWVD
jgi:hypothetical protein